MPFQVSRTDTGQFVLTDPTTDTVVIDDDLAQGFAKLEQAAVDKPRLASTPAAASDPATQGSSAFAFRGGPRYTPILLAVVLPFAWLAVLYFALANLLSETALDRSANDELETRLDELEREVQALRSQVKGAPRTAKTKPARSSDKPDEPPPNRAVQPADEPETEAEAEPPEDAGASNGPS